VALLSAGLHDVVSAPWVGAQVTPLAASIVMAPVAQEPGASVSVTITYVVVEPVPPGALSVGPSLNGSGLAGTVQFVSAAAGGAPMAGCAVSNQGRTLAGCQWPDPQVGETATIVVNVVVGMTATFPARWTVVAGWRLAGRFTRTIASATIDVVAPGSLPVTTTTTSNSTTTTALPTTPTTTPPTVLASTTVAAVAPAPQGSSGAAPASTGRIPATGGPGSAVPVAVGLWVAGLVLVASSRRRAPS
jgi:hypothetical protein